MKQQSYTIAATLLWLLIPLSLWAQDEGVTAVNQPQFGRQVVTVKTGEEILFYDPKGTAAMSSSSSNNTQSLTVFKPEEEGMSVQVTFDSFDVKNDGASYPGKVYVYSGDPDADESFVWATNTYSGFTTMPEGDVMEILDGDYADKSFYSTSPDGILSVGMLWKYAKRCEGWVARVKVIKLTDMTVTGAAADYSAVLSSPKGKANVVLAGFNVTADGIMNPDRLTSVSFKLNKNEAAIDPLSLRLYAGAEPVKDATPIETTVTAEGDAYRMTLDQTLLTGSNDFVIAGDFPLTSAVGTEVELAVTGVATEALPDGVDPFDAATPVTVQNPAIVLMQQGDMTVSVDDTPLTLYDDGGADGQITKAFQGRVTFVPVVEGKKVQIDLTSVKLYGTSYAIYYQYINVYNGKEATPENLIRTFRSDETALIHSTSADGALTLELTHNGLTGFTDDGIEATVSLFEPQAMTLESAVASQVAEGTVCAGDAGQAILKVNLRTQNTEPALTADKFVFTTNGTNAVVTRATLYYGKADATMAVKTQVGEVAVEGDNIVITPAQPVVLAEGDNWFVLTYDISDMALNGQKIDASLTSVTLSGTDTTPKNGNPDGDRTVENTVYSFLNQGTVVKSVNGTLTFKTRAKSDYSSDYESGTDDRINTFVPMHEGMICQIEFSKFALFYGSSSYQPKAKFRIYSGQGTAGDLLWELNSADLKEVGPDRVIRSTSSDGALTVVFNPTESNTYYTAAGFEATVSEYQSQPMTYESAEVMQTAAGIVSVGAEGEALLTVNITTKGDTDNLSLGSLKFGLKGLQANISRLSLYAVGNKDTEPSADAQPVATADVTVDDAEVILTLAEPQVLAEGRNYFRLLVDVAGEAASDSEIDALLQTVNISGTEYTVENGDPDGALTVKDLYILKAGDNGEVVVRPGRNILFYDDGGADNSASKDFEGTVTFVPGGEGDVIKLAYDLIKLSYSDHLYIYNGGSVDEANPARDYSGSNISDKEYVSTAEDGKVTVRFVVKSSYSLPDFAMTVKSYRTKAKEIVASEAVTVAPEGVMRGQQDVPMVRLALTIEGDYDAVDLTRFDVSAEGTGLKNIKVYATGTAGTFTPNNLYGTLTEGTATVEGSYTMTDNETYYFWLTGDIDTAAEVGDKPAMVFTAFTANGIVTTEETPARGETEIKAGVSGTITVGAGADYGTIQAAVDHIAAGIDGPVVISIKRGIYNELVNIPEIPGASALNTITIQSETGDYHDVKVYHNHYSEPVYSEDKMFHEYGVFTIAGADHVTVRGIEFTTEDITFPGILHVKNVSRNVTIEDCYVYTETVTSYSNDINLIYTYARSEANQNNDRLTVRGCLLEGGYIGVRLGGTSTVALPKQVGGVVENCVLRNQGSKGIYAYDELGATIVNNTFENSVSDASTCYGIDINVREANALQTRIEGNRFNFSSPKAAIPLYMRNMVGTADVPVLVLNNEIVLDSRSASGAGIEVSSASSYLNIAHNSVRLTGTDGRAMWFNDSMGEGVNVVNNIFQNETAGPVYRFYKEANVATVNLSHNVISTSGTTFAHAGGDIATYEDWLALSAEADGYNETVSFLSDEILEPAEEGSLLHAAALDYVTVDITGTPRAGQPTIGAYEYNASAEAPVVAEGYPMAKHVTDTTAVVAIKADMNGVAYVMVRPASEEAPAVDDLKASETTVVLRKNAESTVTVEGLVTDEEYIAYVVARSLRGMDGGVVAGAPFIASGEVIVEIPTPELTAEGDTVAAGSEATLMAVVAGGTAPYTLTWMNGKREEVATVTLDEDGTAFSACTPDECDDYTVSVVDANGKTGTATARVIVTGEAVTATFENLYLDPESYWNGFDAVPEGEDAHEGSFVSGSYAFDNGCMPEYSYWYNFGYTNQTATTFESMNDQFHSAAGGGYDGSETFAVAFPSGGGVTVLNKAEGDSIRGFYVTNSAYAYTSMTHGDSFSRKYEAGDWLKLIVSAQDGEGDTRTVEYYLADFRSENESDHYILDTWQWVDLRPLGIVKTLTFALDGTDKSYGYLNTPAYFCMDDFNGHRAITEAEEQTVTGDIVLADLFTFDEDEATVTYALPDGLPEGIAATVEITTDGMLRVNGQVGEDFSLLVSATQRGQIQFVRLPLHFEANGISSARPAETGVTARYTLDGRRTATDARGVTIRRMTDGTVRKVVTK
ncbi:MAG: DUF4465 domain-containing protein [Clostridium sp.]|nr:DUF4465 domain-containing protein [Clostridium sp.]